MCREPALQSGGGGLLGTLDDFAVGLGPAATAEVGPADDFMWGGAASTAFWIDPAENLFAVFVTQLIPSGAFHFRSQFRSLVHAAITD